MLRIEIDDLADRFKIRVMDGSELVKELGWEGGFFSRGGKHYFVGSPFHGLDGDKFRLYEMMPVGPGLPGEVTNAA